MARSTEVVRQWEILRAIDGVRHGIGIAKLAAELDVHPRTIRRDIDALARAGFPLFDDKVNGTSMWKLRARPFRGLEEMGLSLMELCALHFSRTLLCTLGGTPFVDETERAFAKIERALPPGCRRFLDELPRMLKAKPRGRKKPDDDRRLREVLGRALDATLLRRRATMRYASAASRPTKDYLVDALRAWILGFGPEARVVSPVTLASVIFDAADQTRRRYARMRAESRFEMMAMREAG